MSNEQSSQQAVRQQIADNVEKQITEMWEAILRDPEFQKSVSGPVGLKLLNDKIHTFSAGVISVLTQHITGTEIRHHSMMHDIYGRLNDLNKRVEEIEKKTDRKTKRLAALRK